MTRTQLINRLMTCDLAGVLGVRTTKGELKELPDRSLARLLTLYDEVKNAQYQAQSIMIRVTAK